MSNTFTIADLANIFQIIGNIAIVITLIFIGIQLNMTQKITAVSSAQMQVQALNSFYIALATDDDLAFIYRQGRKDPKRLNKKERARFFYTCVVWFSHHENLYEQCRTNHIPKEYFEAWDLAIREDLRDPGFWEYWQEEGAYYDKPFREYVDNIIQPYLLAKNQQR